MIENTIYDLVPKDPIENMLWRVKLREQAITDHGYQRALRDACFQDVMFWFNFACWCFEPRAVVKIKPFVTWCHQDNPIIQMDDAISRSEQTEEPVDVVVDKSRAQGATWMYLAVDVRRFIRDPMFSCGLVTRNEKLADSMVDPDTLMWKVDWMLKRLPPWMLPNAMRRSVVDHSYLNQDLQSTIVAYSATGDVASGGRKTVFCFDEVAKFKPNEIAAAMDSTQHVTNCRILVSTHKGDSGVFYDMTQDEDSNAVKIVLDWRDNPVQAKHKYKYMAGKCIPFDMKDLDYLMVYAKEHAPTLAKIERRGHKIDGTIRSPWYDRQCLRPGATPRSIAQELDRNPRGTVGKVFDMEVLDKVMAESVKPPLWQGKVVYDAETLKVIGLIKQENGPLKLWFYPSIDNRPPMGDYVTGHDISAGGSGDYSSNSAICGADRRSGEQILELAVMGMQAIKFARLSIAIARWLYDAYMIWEATGPTGTTFGKEILEVAYYNNVYYRPVEEVGTQAKSHKAGWWNAKNSDKAELFESLSVAFESELFIPRSRDFVRECGEYEWDGEKIIHKPSQNLGLAGAQHGDRAIAGGVTWLAMQDRALSSVDRDGGSLDNPPYGSFAWRMREAREAERRREETHDLESEFHLGDLLGHNAPDISEWGGGIGTSQDS